jgi:hypothetical protein
MKRIKRNRHEDVAQTDIDMDADLDLDLDAEEEDETDPDKTDDVDDKLLIDPTTEQNDDPITNNDATPDPDDEDDQVEDINTCPKCGMNIDTANVAACPNCGATLSGAVESLIQNVLKGQAPQKVLESFLS